ncbi:MAG: hypothetical protein K6A65_04740, partial [Succinivibrionaceae bacterium]|nr:hypothetical protein [Succinivibrionaceae bacterium]
SSDLSSIFSSLISGHAAPAAAPAAPAAEAAPIPQGMPADLERMASALVDRILVSDPGLGDGSKEVRLMLNDLPGLKGVEISIKRDLSGMLFVAITSSDTGSVQRLISSRQDLERRLAKGERNAVRLDISADGDPQDQNHQG